MTKATKEDSKSMTVIGPRDGELLKFDRSDFIIKFDSDDTDDRFYVANEILEPRTLGSPLHYHHVEDEYIYVVEGTCGAMVGDEVIEAEAGTWVFKPRQEWHAYWNPGDTLCHIIWLVTPGGIEEYIREFHEFLGSDDEQLERLGEKYKLEMDLESVPELCERFGLSLG